MAERTLIPGASRGEHPSPRDRRVENDPQGDDRGEVPASTKSCWWLGQPSFAIAVFGHGLSCAVAEVLIPTP
jgi:hypothetical protein